MNENFVCLTVHIAGTGTHLYNNKTLNNTDFQGGVEMFGGIVSYVARHLMNDLQHFGPNTV